MTARKPRGTITLVEAGPGDPGLLPLRAEQLLAEASLVIRDAAVPPAVASYVGEQAQVVAIGDDVTVDEAIALAVERAREGDVVVRLLAADAFVSGRVTPETQMLTRAKVSWDALPAVPTAVAAAVYAGVPAPLQALVDVPAGGLRAAARELLDGGAPGDTPAVFVRAATTGRQSSDSSDLATFAESSERSAGTLVVGRPVGQRQSWFEGRPLSGLTVLVPRSRAQAGPLSARLRSLGAEPLEVPTIEVEPPRNPASLEKAVSGLVSGRYAWVAFTSANAVTAIRERLEDLGLDARVLSGVKIAAVGAATAEALRGFGLRPDLVPEHGSGSDALVAAWPPYDEQLDYLDRVLAPRADLATDTLIAGLKGKGWAVDDVTAYRTVRAAAPSPEIRAMLRDGGVDAIVFTSSSTARNLVGIAGRPADGTLIVVIGPQTAATCRELGLRVDVEAAETSTEGIVEALAELVAERAAGAAPAAPRARRSASARGPRATTSASGAGHTGKASRTQPPRVKH